jgi:hypothetical protein
VCEPSTRVVRFLTVEHGRRRGESGDLRVAHGLQNVGGKSPVAQLA